MQGDGRENQHCHTEKCGRSEAAAESEAVDRIFFGNPLSAIEVKVKMIYDDKDGDIINLYVGFTQAN